MSIDNERIAGMVRELLDYDGDRSMSAWELNFIENVGKLSQFTQKQADKIEDVWDKVIG